ncbi:MAG: RecBCD enzyme subunit RecD [Planctomycetota bacterium]|jgi:exodeoxyribonuclease V alpha subunit
MTTPVELAAYVAAGIIADDDVAATALLVDMAGREQPGLAPEPLAWVAMGLALRTPRDGHTCVVLSEIGDWAGAIEPGDTAATPAGGPPWPADAAGWRKALRSAGPLVAAPGNRAPFILDGDRLFLAKSLHEEQEIARRLSRKAAGHVEILLGGPGTGKTTTVAKRLIALFHADPHTRIALAAPTGKAAARMAEALRNRLHDPDAPEEVRAAGAAARAAVEAARPVTVHKLLGNRPRGTPRYRFHAGNPLAYDLVVVDEASMLSSSLMFHLLAALSSDTRLLLVGDPDQLASVDAGSVLADLARAAARPGSPLAACTTKLTVRHRFGRRIGGLADAILATDVEAALAVLDGSLSFPPTAATPDDPAAVGWVAPRTAACAALVDTAVTHARRLQALAAAGDVAAALDTQKALQVLCGHREGPLGVAGWNAVVERRLGVAGGSPWYAGRPVMVTRNNPALDLFNGDIGLVVPGADADHMDAVFPTGHEPRRVPVSRLEDVATVHALTIHKSQGSEYRHVVVVLPERPSRIMTRELLYTGVTRASERVTVVGSRAVIAAAIRRPIRRATGLADRL